jgi:hypothetical protein
VIRPRVTKWTFRAQLHAAYLKLGVNGRDGLVQLRRNNPREATRGRLFRQSVGSIDSRVRARLCRRAPDRDEVTCLIRAEIIE